MQNMEIYEIIFVYFFPKLTWTDRVKDSYRAFILSKALNSIHQMNLPNKDFHYKNILVDEFL
jgi:hypothetical protein